MITLEFRHRSGTCERRSFPTWFRPAVIDAYCRKFGYTAAIVDVKG